MDIVYGMKWSFHNNGIHNPWPEEKGRKAHAAKKLYGVAITMDGGIRYGLDVNEVNDFVGVMHLDHAHNSEWILKFARRDQNSSKAIKSGDLFMCGAENRVWTGVPHNSPVISAEMHYFYTYGQDEITMITAQSGGKTETVTSRALDTSKLWTPWPEFGHYEAFLDLQHWLDAAKIDHPRRP